MSTKESFASYSAPSFDDERGGLSSPAALLFLLLCASMAASRLMERFVLLWPSAPLAALGPSRPASAPLRGPAAAPCASPAPAASSPAPSDSSLTPAAASPPSFFARRSGLLSRIPSTTTRASQPAESLDSKLDRRA